MCGTKTPEQVLGDSLQYKRWWTNERQRAECLENEKRALIDENERLVIALHDSITSPKGVVPRSAEEFYDYRKCHG